MRSTPFKLTREQRREIRAWAAQRVIAGRTRGDGQAHALAARLGVTTKAIYHHARLKQRRAKYLFQTRVEMTMIKPTIGRVVWLHRPDSLDSSQPEAALVTFVHSDICINVGGFDAHGNPFSCTSVYLDQGDVPRPEWAKIYAEWMPYQKGQAAKTEALETAAAARAAGTTGY